MDSMKKPKRLCHISSRGAESGVDRMVVAQAHDQPYQQRDDQMCGAGCRLSSRVDDAGHDGGPDRSGAGDGNHGYHLGDSARRVAQAVVGPEGVAVQRLHPTRGGCGGPIDDRSGLRKVEPGAHDYEAVIGRGASARARHVAGAQAE